MREALRLAGLAVTLLASVLWALLAARTPTTTYHVVPLMVAAAWPAIDGSIGAGLTQRRSVNAALGGFVLTVATATILGVKGDLDGPTLWLTQGTGAVLVEHVAFAAVGALAGFIHAVRMAGTVPGGERASRASGAVAAARSRLVWGVGTFYRPGMPDLLVEKRGHVMIATMNRPQRKNAMTLQMFGRMRDAWKEASDDDDIRCIVLTGTGGDFSAGMDLRSLAGDADEHDDWDVKGAMAEHGAAWIYEGLTKTYRPTKPIIAAVEGVAIAGGTEILQGTDIRIAAESAKFGVSEVRWSLYPAGGSPVRLPRQIGYAEAADILLTGKHITAAEAKAMGLISRVVPDGTAFEHALEVAEIVAGNGPLAVEAVLRTMHETSGMTEAEAWAHEEAYANAVMQSDDAKEGPRAFAEKRTPNFQKK